MVRKLSAFILFTFTLAIPAALHAACPAGNFFLDLQTCATANTLVPPGIVSPTAGGACAPAVASPGCTAIAGWKQAALKIVVLAGCTQANVVVEYEGLPCGWTVNLGDSATNNGFGGDAGTSPPFNAELQIVGENLSVYNGSSNPALVDNLATAHLALTNAALKFVVKDQFVSWGNPYTFLQTPNNKILYDLTNPGDRDPRTLYLGLNRVIAATGGRTGYGARRVLVTFK